MLAHDVKPEIEAFDLSMIFKAVEMAQAGKIKGPLHVQFVMGVKNAMPVDREAFEFYVATLRRLAPDATWTGAGHRQGPAHAQSLVAGARRPLPHRARGQCALGQELAGAVQRARWSGGWPSCAPSTAGGRRPWPRRARCCVCRPAA